MSWEKFTYNDKMIITTDWHNMIPSLGIYKPMHLLNHLGPLLVGILLEVKSGNDSYIPTFHVHNLMRELPTISLGLLTTLNREYVHLEWHKNKYQELAKRMNEVALIPFEGNLNLELIISGFKKYAEQPKFLYQTDVYEDIILLNAYYGDNNSIEESLYYAKYNMETWPNIVLKRLGGLDTWLKKIYEKAQDKDKLKEIYQHQSIALKVNQLPMRTINEK